MRLLKVSLLQSPFFTRTVARLPVQPHCGVRWAGPPNNPASLLPPFFTLYSQTFPYYGAPAGTRRALPLCLPTDVKEHSYFSSLTKRPAPPNFLYPVIDFIGLKQGLLFPKSSRPVIETSFSRKYSHFFSSSDFCFIVRSYDSSLLLDGLMFSFPPSLSLSFFGYCLFTASGPIPFCDFFPVRE